MEMRPKSLGPVVVDLAIGVLPVVVVILATLGVILAGIATPTDAGAVGCAAVFLLTLLSRRLTLAKIRRSALLTLEVSSMILLLVAASNLFGAVFSRLGSAEFLASLLTQTSLPPTLMLILILAVIFVLGWPLEWVPIVLIVVPITLPIVQAFNVDMLWYSTLIAVTLQTAWLSPPVALSAYFLKGVVPQWKLKDIYAGMVQFMLLQVVGVGLLLAFPKLATWLPSINASP
jgi:TRAP-type mannitol/chloroaromatic compound transport system permease large subunit